jgi:hypothetical protein
MHQETTECEYYQLDFFHLLPGSAGGRALRDRRGSEYFSELAKSAAAKKTREERQAIYQKGVKERLRRLYTIPRTEIYQELEYLVTERIVPWWPHWRTKRRRRPIFVRIELSRDKVRDMTPEEMLGLAEDADQV